MIILEQFTDLSDGIKFSSVLEIIKESLTIASSNADMLQLVEVINLSKQAESQGHAITPTLIENAKSSISSIKENIKLELDKGALAQKKLTEFLKDGGEFKTSIAKLATKNELNTANNKIDTVSEIANQGKLALSKFTNSDGTFNLEKAGVGEHITSQLTSAKSELTKAIDDQKKSVIAILNNERSTWSVEGVPAGAELTGLTLSQLQAQSKEPYSSWRTGSQPLTQEEVSRRVGDLWLVSSGDEQGVQYTFIEEVVGGVKKYKWQRVANTQLSKAIADLAATKQDLTGFKQSTQLITTELKREAMPIVTSRKQGYLRNGIVMDGKDGALWVEASVFYKGIDKTDTVAGTLRWKVTHTKEGVQTRTANVTGKSVSILQANIKAGEHITVELLTTMSEIKNRLDQ
ncbi:MAG: hypothetical protein SPI35_05830 [Porphyromonas sp.]|nr:hypothetical protein [Porphyromonas sp.]